MFEKYFYVINNYDSQQKKMMGETVRLALTNENLKFLEELSNIKKDYALDIIKNLDGIIKGTEYVWGTEMLEIRSNNNISSIYYSINEVCDTEFLEKIPTNWFIILLKEWVEFLNFVEK